MTVSAFDGHPRQNPCAQCGEPIAGPVWVEPRAHRIGYLWHCRACDYRFEAVAIFERDDDVQDRRAA